MMILESCYQKLPRNERCDTFTVSTRKYRCTRAHVRYTAALRLQTSFVCLFFSRMLDMVTTIS